MSADTEPQPLGESRFRTRASDEHRQDMAARVPQDLPSLYAVHFNAGDLPRLCALYTGDAVVTQESGSSARGPGLRDALAANLAPHRSIRVANRRVYVAGDTAELLTDWWLEDLDAHGQTVTESGRAVDVVRRGTDGLWRYLIDNSMGADCERPAAHRRPLA